MRRRFVSTLALSVAIAGPAAAAPDVPSAKDLEEARALVKTFMTDLKGALQGAIKEGGPVYAIPVCGSMAPGIATRLSTTAGWAVGRTALRVRNPRNAPSVAERAVLMRFLEAAEAGQDLMGMEEAYVVDTIGQRYLHYMKAIPTQKVCLTCHGGELDPALETAIREQYPADAATGFEPGELRGAFTFVKPLE